MKRTWIAVWAVLGVAATFVEAIARLGDRAVSELARGGTAAEWIAMVIVAAVMTYIEGYRALQRRFAPAVVARAFECATRGNAWAALAPLYAVSLVGARGRAVVRAALGVVLIVACVLVVRELPERARAIIDGAVAVALAWGLVALLACFAGAIAGRSRVGAAVLDHEAH